MRWTTITRTIRSSRRRAFQLTPVPLRAQGPTLKDARLRRDGRGIATTGGATAPTVGPEARALVSPAGRSPSARVSMNEGTTGGLAPPARLNRSSFREGEETTTRGNGGTLVRRTRRRTGRRNARPAGRAGAGSGPGGGASGDSRGGACESIGRTRRLSGRGISNDRRRVKRTVASRTHPPARP